MASGRVGGTKSKISGTIGSEVYSLRRNPDGTYSQVVSAKAESVSYSNTEKQAAYRMATAVVEVAMRDLKEIGRISMQSGANRSKSLNAFSSINLSRVHDDMKANWYGGSRFLYFTKTSEVSLGGSFLISSGTLQRKTWEGTWHYFDFPIIMREDPRVYPIDWKEGGGFGFLLPEDGVTMRELLAQLNMTRRDMNVYVDFYKYEYWDEKSDPEDPQIVEAYQYCWMIVKTKADVPDNFVVTLGNVASVFDVQSNFDYIPLYCHRTRYFGLWHKVPFSDLEINILGQASFSVSYINGYKQISNSTLVSISDTGKWDWIESAPVDVFWSWLNESTPSRKPSPF